jgi:hypothetical protein
VTGRDSTHGRPAKTCVLAELVVVVSVLVVVVSVLVESPPPSGLLPEGVPVGELGGG